MTTLITGGTGFVGAELARLLIEEGDRPILLDIAPLTGPSERLKNDLDYVRGSVANLPEVLNAITGRGVDRIIHLAGMLSLPSEENPWAAFNVNAGGTYNVLEGARIFGVDRVVFSSSIAVYSDDLPDREIDESACSKPRTMYGSCKVFGELLGRFYARRFGLDFRGLRLPSVVGPFSAAVHMSSYNCWAIEEPLKGRAYRLPVEPWLKVPAIYFKDAARALLLLSKADRKSIPTMVYNVAGISPAYTAQELVDAVVRKVPDSELSFEPDPQVMALLKDIGQMNICDERARKEWGWEPSYNLDQMVDDFVAEFCRRQSGERSYV
jgi:threonine 3-dehydrogenase